ncbi:carboxypeptidase-like regulatory domain-containing protein, partial [Parabacteroides goldsteinii]
MVKRIHLIVLLVLLQAVTGVAVLYAQSMTSASGIVKDSITGEPLAFVSVYFDGSTIGAMTDDNGAFAL